EPFHMQVHELFAPDASDDGDVYPVSDGTVDLEPLIRDAVLLAMPFAPLCRPGCLGLCERCGGDRNLNECTCAPEADPRWAALEPVRTHREEPPPHATPEAQAGEAQDPLARRPLEATPADVRGVPAVPSAEAAPPGVRQLRVLRRPAGHRGRAVEAG